MILATSKVSVGRVEQKVTHKEILPGVKNINAIASGKGGTGKTTFLKYIRENCHKQMASFNLEAGVINEYWKIIFFTTTENRKVTYASGFSTSGCRNLIRRWRC